MRLQGLWFQLPHRGEVDAHMVYQARMLEGATTEVESYRGTYPLLLPRLYNLMPHPQPLAPAAASLEEHRARAGADIWRMRLLIACLGSLIVPATFFLARRLLSDPAALLAAALAGFNLLHLSLSQQARPHAAAAAFATWAMVACLSMRRELTWSSCLMAALAVGLTLGSLHNGLAMLLPLGAAWLWRARGPRAFALVLAVVVAGLFLWSYGTTWMAVDADTGKWRQGSHAIEPREFNGGGFKRIAQALWSYAPVSFVLAGAGLVLLLLRGGKAPSGTRPLERGDYFVLGAFVLPFLLANGIFERFDQRFAMPLVPYLACLAAYAAESAWRTLAGFTSSPRARGAIAAVLGALILAFPLWMATRLVQLRMRPDTLSLASAWIEQNLAHEDRIVVMTALDLPLFHDDESLKLNGAFATETNIFPRFTQWFRYQREVQRASKLEPFPHRRWNLVWINPWNVPQESGAIQIGGASAPARYAVVEHYPEVRANPGNAALEARVRTNAELLVSFSCYKDGDPERMHLEYEGPWPHSSLDMTRTLRACERFGPGIAIYRLNAAEGSQGGG